MNPDAELGRSVPYFRPESPVAASPVASCGNGSTEPGIHVRDDEARGSNGRPAAAGAVEGVHAGRSQGAQQDGAGSGKEGGCAPLLPSEPSAEKHGLQEAGSTSEEDNQEQPKAAERLGPGMREKLK